MSEDKLGRVVVAGHICIDIIPTIDSQPDSLGAFLKPGQLVNVGPALMSTGGSVSNTGLALHRLGVPTSLIGKLGDDLFGQATLDLLRCRDEALVGGMVISNDAPSSYTIVINPRGMDRSFLHCPGANDTFGPEDVDVEKLEGASLFHFGYPPLMRRMFADGGYELTELLRKARKAGVATSLDLAHIDLASAAGQVDWKGLLRMALREVDFFVPSLDEVFPILQPETFAIAEKSNAEGFMACVNAELLHELSDELLQMGVAVVYLKMGDQGIYLRTTTDADRLRDVRSLELSDEWLSRELLAPAYQVDVVGTTGAGDCAIAGFIAGIVRDQSPDDALCSGVAAGGANVEAADAASGVPPWTALQARVSAGWGKLPLSIDTSGWLYDDRRGLWVSPNDLTFASLVE
jgi:sugar/nucleoside kinase (ribokinase family)